MVKRSHAEYLQLFLLLAVLLAPCDAAAAGMSPRKVLLLTSYHQGDRWNDSVVKGVREALGSLESLNLSIENLDMRRYTDQDHTRLTTEYIRAKYQGKPQDLVLVSDDPALNFLLTVRKDLFPNTPVVFCGANNFTPKHIQGQHNITGVNEALSLEATLELALKLFPQTTRIKAMVSDTDASSRANLEQYRAAAARMEGRVQFDELLNMTDKDAPDILSHMPKDSLILHLSPLLKPEGGLLSVEDGIRILSAYAPIPVFTLWSFALGDFALGGYVSSGQDQGRTAGNLVIRILEGQGADQIPVIMDSPNVPMFDYNVMKRFGVNESALPEGSVVLNYQMSMWEQYWLWFIGIALFCGLQTVLILSLLHHRRLSQKATATLSISEQFLKVLLESLPLPVFFKDVEGRYKGFNKAFENFYGSSKLELIGRSVFDIHPPELAKIYHAKDLELLESVSRQTYESQVKNAHGELRNVIFHKATLTNASGAISGLVGAILDITERKQAEEALRKNEELLSRAQEIAHTGSWKLDLTANHLTWSDEVYRIFGYEPQEFAATYEAFLDAFHPDDRALVDEIYSRSLREGSDSYELEHRIVRRNSGEVRYVLERCVHERDDAGTIIQSTGMLQDITDRKQAEAEREKLQAQLTQAQKIELVGRLAGGVAHDFNNMLGVILGYTELAMQRVKPDDPLHANLEKIQGAAQRSAELTRQLLAFARKQTVSPKVIDLNDTIESMLKLLRRLIGENIDLTWQPGKEVWPVKIDPTQIDQILTNLFVNARDAITDLGKVTIETGNTVFDEDYCRVHAGFVPGEYAILALSDNGCGMDEETQSHLFEPFFTTKEMGKGTGLGLATVYGVVKQNNGFINVYSAPGQGTTFKIYLPRHLAKAVPLPEKVPDTPGERGHETVLLVEDERAILEMITTMLESLGYTVLAAGTPGEAVRLAQEHRDRIDLLLTDVVMPEMNGRDLAKNLLSIYPDIRRLFMSGYTANVIAHHGVLDEGVHFIHKPFSMNDLGAKLREALSGRQVDLVTDRAEG